MGRPNRETRRGLWTLAVAVMVVVQASGPTAEAKLAEDTVRAWDAYVKATETRIAQELSSPRGFFAMDFEAGSDHRARAVAGAIPMAEMETQDEAGEVMRAPSGSITHWCGSVFVRGVTLDAVLSRAQHPQEQGPFQPDVLALRVLERRPDGLTLFIKMRRQKIVTVTYNTEHELTYTRHAPTRASSRSVATRIAEVETTSAGERELSPGDDHGFLWRLHSYWRYEQVAGGVLVELESLSLSRDIPLGLGLLARPLVSRIAQESMERTLVFFRDQMREPD